MQLLKNQLSKTYRIILGSSANGDTLENSDFLDDFDTALAAIPSNGTMFIRDGNYNVTASVIVSLKNIVGQSKDGVILTGTGQLLDGIAGTIENLTFNNVRLGIGTETKIENCLIKTNISAITLISMSGGILSKCEIKIEGSALPFTCVNISGGGLSKALIIDSCIFSGNGNQNENSAPNGFIFSNSGCRAIIFGCTFKDMRTTGATDRAAFFMNDGTIIAFNNHFQNIDRPFWCAGHLGIISENIMDGCKTGIESGGTGERNIINNIVLNETVAKYNVTGSGFINADNQ